jgi:ubiquinone/menaquinone biosynthesis C-methylase UbiE
MYASAGAKVTVVDISEGMLELDRQVAEQRRLPMRILKASMAAMPMLVDGEFDLVVHPVSTCYVSDVRPVFTEVARVLRAGGLYISQHKQPVNLQASLEPRAGFYAIEQPLFANRPVKSPTTASRLREPGTHEYAHTLEQLLGAMCRAGMVIEDLTEPNHAKPDDPLGAFGHRCSFISPYLRVKARRVGASHSQLIL